MATADDYAAWIVQNADKKGTPDFDTVAKAYQLAKGQEPQPAPPPTTIERFPELAGGDPVGELRDAAVGFGYGLDRAAAGLRQIVPDGVRNALDNFGQILHMGPSPSIDPQVQAANKATLAPLETKRPFLMGTAESGPMLFAPTPLTMAAMAGLNYGTPQERMKEAALTYGVSKVGDLAAQGITKVLGGDLATPEAKALMGQGITPTPGQTIGLKSAEEKASSVPILGEQIRGAQRRSIEDFNRATYARALAPLGDEGAAVAASAPAGNEGIAKVGDYLSGKYEELLAKSVPTPLDNTFQQRMVELGNMVPQAQQPDFVNAVRNNIVSRMTNGVLTPSAAKQAESDLGRMAANYMGSSVASERELGLALQQAQANLRAAVARANPETGPAIQSVNQAWANLTQLERAGAMLGAKEGVFSPSQYLNAIKAGDKSVRDRAFARGQMPNQDFAQAADAVLSNRVPNSGTIDRGLGVKMAADLVTHPVSGALGLVGSLLGSIPYSAPGQRAVASLLGGSAAQTPLQQEILRRLGIASGGLLGQAIGQ